MDDSQQALNEATQADVEAPTTQTEEPKVETEEKAEVATEAPAEKPEKANKPTEVETEESKKSAQSRIRELAAEKKAAEDKAQSLAEKVAELTGSLGPSAQAPYQPQIQPGMEVSPEQFQQEVARAADSIVQLRMAQDKVLNKVNEESREVVQTYPQLNPKDKEHFDKELSESISTATMAMISRTPTASVKDFVESLMKPYMRSVEKGVGEVHDEMAKQVVETALRPTTVQAREKDASEMTLKELEKKLGVVN